MRLQWDKPDERFLAYGVDRGVLYCTGAKPGLVDNTNYIYNTSAEDGTTTGWQTYGASTTLVAADGGSYKYFVIGKSVAGSQMGMRTTVGAGMTARPAGTIVTISAEVRNPSSGQSLTQAGFILRDDTNNDSAAYSSIVAGSINSTVPADNAWRQIWVTVQVKAGRNLENIYVQKPGTPLITELLHVRNIQVNDGDKIPFFNGDSEPDDYVYEWTAVPYRSISTRKKNPAVAVPWNGITGFDEGPGGASNILYRDGQIYLADVDASDFTGKLSALFYPDEFGDCVGIPMVTDGLFVDGQKPKRFSFAYRTLVGSGIDGDWFGYQLHLVYNAMATINTRQRKTIGQTTDPTTFDFDIVCTPTKLAGYRPTAHYIIDTRYLDAETIGLIEDMLYGTDTTPGLIPDISAVFDLLAIGNSITITSHPVSTIGSVYPVNIKTYTVKASNTNAYALDPLHFKVDNANVVDNGDGTWTVSDGGNTTVINE